MELTIALLTFVGIFLAVFGFAGLAGMIRHPVDERIDTLRAGGRMSQQHIKPSDETIKDMLTKLGKKVAPEETKQNQDTRQRLMMAGYYSDTAYHLYWGIRIILTLALPIVVFLAFQFQEKPIVNPLFPTIFAFGIGMFLPDFFIYWKKKKRHEQIFRGLPDALDLLVVCLEAGLGLDAAMQRVSEEFHINNPDLSEELRMTCTSIRLGQPRNEALRELGSRTGVIDLKTLVAVLIQADRFGTSMAQALRVHADDMRTRRKQRAEELAAKTTVKLIFPLVLFIFPSIFVVLAGPAIIKIMENFVNK